jgi:PKD repeat protein
MKVISVALIVGMIALLCVSAVWADECASNIEFTSDLNNLSIGNTFLVSLEDSTGFCDAGQTCWGVYKGGNATLNFSSTNLSTQSSNPIVIQGNANSYDWTVNTSQIGFYEVNVTLVNATNSSMYCHKNISINVTAADEPNFVLNFTSTVGPTLQNGTVVFYNITINNTGNGSASNVIVRMQGDELNYISASNYTLLSINNNSVGSFQMNFTTVRTGSLNITAHIESYDKTGEAENACVNIPATTPVVQNSDTCSQAYNTTEITIVATPVIQNAESESLPNIRILNGTTNSTINLTNYLINNVDQNSITWNYTTTGGNLTINISNNQMLNITPITADWTGKQNITFNATNAINLSTTDTIIIYVYNSSTEVCNGIDDDGDTLLDTGCDDDGDGYCDANMSIVVGSDLSSTCLNTDSTSSATISSSDDCHDNSSAAYPGHAEVGGDGLDNDCDGDFDESPPQQNNGGGSGGGDDDEPDEAFTAIIKNPIDGMIFAINELINFKGATAGFSINLNYLWDFKDGTKSIEKNPTHKFSKKGSYNVLFTAASQSEESSDTVNVYVAECTTDNQCQGSCIFAGETKAYCCKEVCQADVDCDNGQTCSNGCCKQACDIACTSNSDCDDDKDQTVDKCLNPNTCNAKCENKYEDSENNNNKITIINPKEKLYTTRTISLQYDTNFKPSKCEYKLNNANKVTLKTKSKIIDANDGDNTLTIYCDNVQESVNFLVNDKDPRLQNPANLGRTETILDSFFDLFGNQILSEEQIKAILIEAFNAKELFMKVVTENINGQTYISHFVANTKILPLKDVKIRLTIPKHIANSTDEITSIQEFRIIEKDPIIEFDKALLDKDENFVIKYGLNKEISQEEAEEIVVEITYEEISEKALEELLAKQAETSKAVKIKTSAEVGDDKTKVTTTVNPKNELDDVSIYLRIPKCLAEKVSQVQFQNTDYEIIEEDPLIVWHFTDVNEKIDLAYEVEGEIDEECWKQIEAMALAEHIGIKIKKKNNLLLALLPIILIPLIGFIVVYLSKFNKPAPNYTNQIQPIEPQYKPKPMMAQKPAILRKTKVEIPKTKVNIPKPVVKPKPEVSLPKKIVVPKPKPRQEESFDDFLKDLDKRINSLEKRLKR